MFWDRRPYPPIIQYMLNSFQAGLLNPVNKWYDFTFSFSNHELFPSTETYNSFSIRACYPNVFPMASSQSQITHVYRFSTWMHVKVSGNCFLNNSLHNCMNLNCFYESLNNLCFYRTLKSNALTDCSIS